MRLSQVLLLAGVLLTSSVGGSARASARPKPLRMAELEAHNEMATPGFTQELRDARRIARFLGDALMLNNAQLHAVECCTLAERQALALAATPADLALAQRAYLQAVRQVLVASQLHTYAALCQQLAGSALPLDGTELAVR